LEDENWDLGVFSHGEFKYDISFLFCATSGLQTGSEKVKKWNMGGLR
jgi:hypothetical protein